VPVLSPPPLSNSPIAPRAVMRALIVDDEPIARQVLREELATFPDIEIAGEAEDGHQALAQIERLQPDLILLDIQMPGRGGFDVLRQLPPGALPIIVIVTAYDKHAIAAFEAGAIDYLLKPVSHDRLEKALTRAHAMRGQTSEIAASLERLSDAAGKTRRIAGKAGEEYHLIDLADVLAFQADREIVWVITAKKRYMATHTLREIDERLRGTAFQRVHRNALVNVDHVRKMTPLTSQRWLLTLSGGLEFIASKRLAHNVRQMLQW
jgi:two-component system LytT family response regulator